MKPTLRHHVFGILGVGALVLAACGGGGGGGGASSSSAAPQSTQEPGANDPANQGGTMTISLVQEPTSFLASGITDSMTFSYAANAPVTEGLLWYRSTDDTANAKSIADFWAPDLATEVPTPDNGDVKTSGCKNTAAKMCVTWKLRSGVTWHDGTPFTAADVCATFDEYWLKYGNKNPTALLNTAGWDRVIKCTQDSTTQATIDFKEIYGPYLTLGSGVYGIIPAKLLNTAFAGSGDIEKTPQTVDLTYANPDAFKGTDTLDKLIVGTGPYVFQKYEPGKDIILLPNKHYWNAKTHPAHLNQVVLKFIPDVQTQLDQARAGQIDFGLDYRLRFLKDLQSTASGGKIKVETIPESGAEKLDLNICDNAKGLCGSGAMASGPLADVKFRKAMLEAINRQQIVDTIASGATVVPLDGWSYLGSEWTKDPSTDSKTNYDAAKAASDLDAAGYKVNSSCKAGSNPGRATPDGKCINLQFVTTAGNPARAAAQVAIQADLEKAGIETTLSTVKAGKLFGSFADGGVLYTHTFQIAMYTNTVTYPAEPDSWYPAYHADCGGSCTGDVQIPSAANKGTGQNDTGEDNPQVDKALDDGRHSVDLSTRAKAYMKAWSLLAKDLPELPIYQQVTVNSYTTKLRGLKRNDLTWTYNLGDWYCIGGNCQA